MMSWKAIQGNLYDLKGFSYYFLIELKPSLMSQLKMISLEMKPYLMS